MRTLLLLTALLAGPAILAAQTAPLACDGRMATVRVSEVPATGTSTGFLAAVAAQKAWYAAHAPNDEVYASPVIVRDEKTKQRAYSTKQYITFHIRGAAAGPAPQHDEAYDAFVKLYRANSEIKSEYNLCLPNPTAR